MHPSDHQDPPPPDDDHTTEDSSSDDNVANVDHIVVTTATGTVSPPPSTPTTAAAQPTTTTLLLHLDTSVCAHQRFRCSLHLFRLLGLHLGQPVIVRLPVSSVFSCSGSISIGTTTHPLLSSSASSPHSPVNILCRAFPWPAQYSSTPVVTVDSSFLIPETALECTAPALIPISTPSSDSCDHDFQHCCTSANSTCCCGFHLVDPNIPLFVRSVSRPSSATTVTVVRISPSNAFDSKKVNADDNGDARFLKSLLFRKVVRKGCLISSSSGSQLWKVTDTIPKDFVVFTSRTQLSVIEQVKSDLRSVETGLFDARVTNAGGIEGTLKVLRDYIMLPKMYPKVFNHLGVVPTKGILLKGEPGVGKTYLVNVLAEQCRAWLVTIGGAESFGIFVGDAEKYLKRVFSLVLSQVSRQEMKNPCIIFIDELDALCPARTEESSGHENRIVAQLLSLLDGIGGSGRRKYLPVMVIAATNRPNAIDPALRRPGRFDKEIDLNVPEVEERLKILQEKTSKMFLLPNVDLCTDFVFCTNLDKIASDCIAYVAGDISALCREAFLSALSRSFGDCVGNSQKVTVSNDDFSIAFKKVCPSTHRTTVVGDVGSIRWTDIGGIDEVKNKLRQVVEFPLLHPEVYDRFGISASNGVLLHGPSGCCKTTLVKAKISAPSILFFDEIQ